MSIEEFGIDLAELCSRSPVASGQPLCWTIIANPQAGGFTIRSRWRRHREILRTYAEKARSNPLRPAGSGPSRTAREVDGGSLGALGLVLTRRPAHAGEIVRALIDEAAAEPPETASFHLIITAGGDGTSLEALTALYYAPPVLRSRCAVLRLPLGTGNDGADARELDRALDLLLYPTRIELTPGVRLRTATPGKGPFLAFNILSLGLDAFVAYMTNKMKGKMPGDSYKLWVDLVTLFYDLIYRIVPLSVVVRDEQDRPTLTFSERLLFLAFGVSGHRTYGANIAMLPDQRNVCAVRFVSIPQRIILKQLFISGRHADRPEARLFDAQSLELRGDQPMPAQMDGEVIRLEAADFPVHIELTEPAIPVLRRL